MSHYDTKIYKSINNKHNKNFVYINNLINHNFFSKFAMF